MISIWQLAYMIPLDVVLSSRKVQYLVVRLYVNTGYGVYASSKTRNTLIVQRISCFGGAWSIYVNLRGKNKKIIQVVV